jgi:hypothetical protein
MDDLTVDKRIGSGEFPIYHYKRLLLWGFCDRKSKGALLKDIGVARVEVNDATIERKLEATAQHYHISVAELSQLIFSMDQGTLKDEKDKQVSTVAQLEEFLERRLEKVLAEEATQQDEQKDK